MYIQVMFNRFIRYIKQHLVHMSWISIALLLLAHAIGSWLLLYWAGESDLVSFDSYLYYYIVTTSTVGYGDLSPSGYAGKMVVSLFQIPLGLVIFGALLGKLGQSVSKVVRQVMTGEKDFSELDSHILIFGWHDGRTTKIVNHILGDNKRVQRKILLCVKKEMEHPFLDNPMVEFARLKSFTSDEELQRISIERADRIIVDGSNDDQTFTCALKLSGLVADDCHISAYFNDETKVEMLNKYTNNIECNSSKTAEILVRSMQDPGSSRLQEEMMSTLYGDTQFSTQIPDDVQQIKFESVFQYLKAKHNAILLAVAEDRIGTKLHLNPDNTHLVSAGEILHYVAKERIIASEINWQQLEQTK